MIHRELKHALDFSLRTDPQNSGTDDACGGKKKKKKEQLDDDNRNGTLGGHFKQ